VQFHVISQHPLLLSSTVVSFASLLATTKNIPPIEKTNIKANFFFMFFPPICRKIDDSRRNNTLQI